MRHIVSGLFSTYEEAAQAREALALAGFARADIELQARPLETPAGASVATSSPGVLANVERFVASLFVQEPAGAVGPGERAPAFTDDGAEPPPINEIRQTHGDGVLVCAAVNSALDIDLARRTLAGLGARDIGERVQDWGEVPGESEAGREHSPLDELGLGSLGRASTPEPNDLPPSADPLRPEPPEPVPGVEPASATALAAGAAPGSGAVLQPEPSPEPLAADEYSGFADEEAVYGHDDASLSGRGTRTATVPRARTGQNAAASESWERLRAAVRHGWERVTNHHL